jgi:hypothetical protein
VLKERFVRIVLSSLGLVTTLACGSNTATCPCQAPSTKPPSSSAVQAVPVFAPSAESEPAPEPSPFGAEPESIGWIELVIGDERKLIAGDCYETWPGYRKPFVQILDPDTASPRFILDSCGADAFHLDVVGKALTLPGKVEVMRLRIQDPESGQEWISERLELEVTEFGEPGGSVRGQFQGVMAARLNRPGIPVRGRFWTRRAQDRFAP